MHLAIATSDCKSAARYGNQVASVQKKVFNATPVYIDICQSEDPEARASAIETILSWPAGFEFSSPDDATLSYPEDLVLLMVELGEFEAAMVLAERNLEYYSHIVLTRQRNNRTVNGLKFYCDPRFQQLIEQSSVPPMGGENTCD
jgi:hypothetical protein